MRTQLCFLLASLLLAQAHEPVRPLGLDLRMDLGAVPAMDIRLAPPGCWDGLLLGLATRTSPPAHRGKAEAIVEVWDLLPPTSPRREAFDLFLGSLRDRLSRAWAQPPPKLQALELGEFMQSDPSQPQKLDLTRVKSMQDHFNRRPTNGSPVK